MRAVNVYITTDVIRTFATEVRVAMRERRRTR
jgi:hypothetical protein